MKRLVLPVLIGLVIAVALAGLLYLSVSHRKPCATVHVEARREPSQPALIEEEWAGSAAAERATAPRSEPSKQRRLDPNAWLTGTYLGGEGATDRLVKLINDGVTIDGKQVKLEAFTHRYAQAFPIPTTTALGLSAETERARLLTRGGKTYLQVGIQAAQREAPRRPPLNVCLVVDRSGSMNEEGKIKYAYKAASEVVDRLQPTDTISVVAYDDTAHVLVRATKVTDKEALHRALEGLSPGGSTDIYSGLELGYREVTRGLDHESLHEVILISDGMVTRGTSDLGAFARLASRAFSDDIQTTAIGMGLDYDEDLMMTVAREGKGNYHFVKDAASIQDILHEELDQLTHVVAKALRLRIRLADGVSALRVLGSAEMDEDAVAIAKATEKAIDDRVYRDLGIRPDRRHTDDEPGLKMLIPQFAMGDSHVVMVEIEVPPGRGTRKVADVYLKYKDIVFPANREAQVAASIQYTDSDDAMVASIRQSVKKNVLGFQTGEVLQRAAARLDRGEAGEAARLIDEQMVVLGVAAREWKDPDLDRDGKLLAAYRDVISGVGTRYAYDPDLDEYLGRSLTYSAYQRTR
jgi:Ca-activated chloride channel family protein